MFLKSADYSSVYNEPEVYGACMINNLLSPVALMTAVGIIFMLRFAAINDTARIMFFALKNQLLPISFYTNKINFNTVAIAHFKNQKRSSCFTVQLPCNTIVPVAAMRNSLGLKVRSFPMPYSTAVSC